MGRLRAAPIVFACAVALALGVSACGGSDSNLLPGKTAEQINRNLDQVRAYVAEGDCAGAEDAVNQVREQVDGLGGVDKQLKAALREGTTRLGQVVSSCGQEALEEAEAEQKAAEREAEQQEQEAVEAEEEELSAAKQEQKEEKAQQKAEKEAEKEQQQAEKDREKEEEGSLGKGVEKGNGPPAETPSGNEPPAGGVGPGTETE
ncbi:MAG: hypothetical protein JST31_09970 [Actinobacteria bacterium]|nr:hypothetical protein [Actinomycetota bacterium]